ncbi:MAG: extracellular solute-binding protein [Pseudomonadota bacterium]
MTSLSKGCLAVTSVVLSLALSITNVTAQTVKLSPEDSPSASQASTSEAATKTDDTQAPLSKNTSTQPASPKPSAEEVTTSPDTSPTTEAAETAVQPKPTPPPAPPKSLTVATWDGAYGEAQRIALFDPFASRTGIAIKTKLHTDGARLRKPDTAEQLDWDIAHIPSDAAIAACDAGTVIALTDMQPKPDQFISGSIGKCHVASAVWSSVIAVRVSEAWPETPTALADVFDPKRFPGKRAFPRQPRFLLETALLADGVAPSNVYATLATDVGLARAFARLENMRPHIVWWRATSEVPTLLAKKNVRFAFGFNGRFFNAFAGRKDVPHLIWDGQLYGMNAWVIPAKSRHSAAAKEFISAALTTDVMRAQASRFPYGPTRLTAAKPPLRNDALGLDITGFLPTAPDNFSRALEIDEAWWQRNEARLIDRFNAWVDGEAAPAPEAE